MKIAIDARCLTHQLSGIGYYCLNIIRELRQLDLDITLLTPAPLSLSAQDLKGISVIQAKFSRPFISRQVWMKCYLPLLLRRYHFDLLWGPAHSLVFFASPNLAKVLTIHDLVCRYLPKTMRLRTWVSEKLCMSYSLKKADIIVAISVSTAQHLKNDYPAFTHKVKQIASGPGNIALFSECEQSSIPLDLIIQEKVSHPYILSVGTLEPRKNLIRLVQAYYALPQQLKSRYHLLIVGGDGWGNTHHQLKNMIASYGLSNQVFLLGYQSNHHLFHLYKNAYCFVMPSLYEGFGLPLLEAQWYGVPVITANRFSMIEIAGDGGLFIDPYCTKSLTDALERLLGQTHLRESLSIKAIENARKYSWKKTAESLFSVFREAVEINKFSQRKKGSIVFD